MSWFKAILGAFSAMGEAVAAAFGWFARKEQRDAGKTAAELEVVEERVRRLREKVEVSRRLSRADADELERLLRERAGQ